MLNSFNIISHSKYNHNCKFQTNPQHCDSFVFPYTSSFPLLFASLPRSPRLSFVPWRALLQDTIYLKRNWYLIHMESHFSLFFPFFIKQMFREKPQYMPR